MSVTVPAAGDDIEAAWGIEVSRFLNIRTAIVAATGSFSTTQTKIVQVTCAANTLEAGHTYRLEAWGIASNSGGSARTLTLRVRCGPTTLTGNIAGARTPNINVGASSDGFKVEALFTVRTAGASGTCLAQMLTICGPSQPLNSASFVTPENSTVAVDTTVSNRLELTAVTAHTDATVNFYGASIERVA